MSESEAYDITKDISSKCFRITKLTMYLLFSLAFSFLVFVTMNPTFLKLSIFASCFIVNIYFYMIFHQLAKKNKTTSPINKNPDIPHYLSNNKLYKVFQKINLKSSKFTITSFLFFHILNYLTLFFFSICTLLKLNIF
ncbi:MAG: hypothetical protein K1060chlam4_00204 [Candidatus Anoxychlamydiales bacterium]|nr:hypothetical protein [Candidatus Anoxychlamydiales bacterium]